MKIEQSKWTRASGWIPALSQPAAPAQLLLVFGETSLLKDAHITSQLRNAYPGAHMMGCTTAGEICGTYVSDDSVVVTAVTFEQSQIRGARINLSEVNGSFQAGDKLAQSLPKQIPGLNSSSADVLAHVFVLSDGLGVNGSELVAGMMKNLPEGISVTGGLAGDGARFGETLTLWDDIAASNRIVALGLYGSRLRIGFGSLGGWDSFGPERLVTRSKGNVLFELDGKSALDLYKKYLGEHAHGLPSTGLLFPLSLRTRTSETSVVRTILNVDDAQQSMTFAGDIPEGSRVRLMKANFDRLIDGATGAASACHQAANTTSPELAILISCVGRKLVLKQRIEEEVEGVRSVLGEDTVLAGFYSYGEISPFTRGGRCELHNQTMTITTFAEV
jgi:hypothetical protein